MGNNNAGAGPRMEQADDADPEIRLMPLIIPTAVVERWERRGRIVALHYSFACKDVNIVFIAACFPPRLVVLIAVLSFIFFSIERLETFYGTD